MSSIPKRPRSSKRVKAKDRISALPDAILSTFSHTFQPNLLLLLALYHQGGGTFGLLSLFLIFTFLITARNLWKQYFSFMTFQVFRSSASSISSLCTSQTLVILRLGRDITIQLPTSVWFPSLKILEISVYHPDNNFIQKLLCSCPILENLNIEATLGKDEVLVFTIFMPMLKRLAIYLKLFEHRQYHDHKITIDTPSLENITLCDAYLACYSVKTQTSLIKASLGIGQYRRQCDSGGMNLANRLYDIFEGLSTVKSLSLSLEILDLVGDYNLPMFYNLMHMDMHINNCKGWPQVLKLIKSMPNLEILELSIQSCQNEVDSSAGELISGASHEVPSCLLSRLKEMKVRNFDGCKEKMNLVKYLLKNSEVLQKVTIGFEQYFNLYKTKKKKPWKELLSCAKRSKTCQIFLIEEEDLSNSML